MNIKQKVIPIAAVVVMFGTITASGFPAFAANDPSGGNFFTGIVQFLANTFHLDQGQVQTAVNTYKTQHKATAKHNMGDREKKSLDALVSQNKITSAQETSIIAEQAVLKVKYNPANFKSLTPDQRKQQFTNEQNDIKSWAQSEGIDPKYVMPFGGMMGKESGGRGFGRWQKPSVTPSPTP